MEKYKYDDMALLSVLAFPGSYYDAENNKFDFGTFDFNNIKTYTNEEQIERSKELCRQINSNKKIIQV